MQTSKPQFAAETQKKVKGAMVRKSLGVGTRLLDHAFAFAFRGLVYAQIWEDPDVDMEALQIQPDSRIVAIASGGCNVLSYLVADPAAITAVDLNTAHVALNKLKLASARHLPDYALFRRFFGEADSKANIEAYHAFIAPHLDEPTRRYWEGRDLIGRRRIGGFQKGIYKRGLLGNFIGVAHLLAKVYRIDLSKILAARSIEEQRAVFETEMAPVFDKKFVRWLTDQPASLFGLGIPPAQFDVLAGDQPMASVLRRRLEKLACDFDISDNYFAWQAFSRGYGRAPECPLPPYLQAANWQTVRARVDRVDVRHANMTEHLAAQPDASLDRYVLLDAQDWMTDDQLNDLWRQITRTARPGARVLFRTAAEPSLLPGRLDDAVLARWNYHAEASLDYTRRDRSSIYGGVHLYELA
ncbi:MAG: BtaA family protein [Proteobacteria bacterium]|nr:BtaA family protein [Pseudomonadota bacterium]